MKALPQFLHGLKAYFRAVKMIFATQMWLSFAIPALLSIGLYYGGDMITDHLKAYKFERLEEADGSEFLLLGAQFTLVYVTKFMNKYLVLVLLAPLLASLSVYTEFLLTGNRYSGTWATYFNDVKRALRISARNMTIQLLWMAGYFLLSFPLGLPSWVGKVFYMLVAFYFYGFSFMDYVGERRKLSLEASVKFTRKHWPVAYALGSVYGLLFFLPDFGFALEPGVVLAPILGVVAGTIAVHGIVDLSRNPYALRDKTTEGFSISIEIESERDWEA